MHVQHMNPHTANVGHQGVEYTALRDGIFDVPDHVGEELLAQPGWSRYYGELPYEVATATAGPAADSGTSDWAAAGRAAAEQRLPRRVPDGLQPRSRDAREFLAGYDEAVKAGGAPAGEPGESGQQEPAPAE